MLIYLVAIAQPPATSFVHLHQPNAQSEVIFEIHGHALTSWGDHIYLTGSIPELGCWNPDQAVRELKQLHMPIGLITMQIMLSSESYPTWKAKVKLSAGTTSFEYKLIRKTPGQAVRTSLHLLVHSLSGRSLGRVPHMSTASRWYPNPAACKSKMSGTDARRWKDLLAVAVWLSFTIHHLDSSHTQHPSRQIRKIRFPHMHCLCLRIILAHNRACFSTSKQSVRTARAVSPRFARACS